MIKNWLRIVRKRYNIYLDFYRDARDYSKYYIDSAEIHGNPKYRIMLLVHSLEKGMCMENLRPFGQAKAYRLMVILRRIEDRNDLLFERNLAISVLYSWITLFDDYRWNKDKNVLDVEKYLNGKEVTFETGRREYSFREYENQDNDFTRVILSRHSVRDFKTTDLSIDDLNYAVNMFIEAPTACNRQMCKIYYVKNKSAKEILNKRIKGISGFNTSAINYFVITFDIAALDYSGERHQGYLNSGLVAMNFANGLHAKGIGSCFLQYANNHKEDSEIRKALSITQSERIAVILAAGYYKDVTIIPCSHRRPVTDVLQIVE